MHSLRAFIATTFNSYRPVITGIKQTHLQSKPRSFGDRIFNRESLVSGLFSTQSRVGGMADNQFCIEYAARGTAACKKCKEKIPKETIRIAKITANPFNDDPNAVLKNWHHVKCIFDVFSRARVSTKTVEDVDELTGWNTIKPEDRPAILKLIEENSARFEKLRAGQKKKTPVKGGITDPSVPKASVHNAEGASPAKASGLGGGATPSFVTKTDVSHKDNSFRSFRILVANIADTPGYLDKTNLIKSYITKGNDGEFFKGDLYLTMKLLLPGVVKRIYNLNAKQIVKLFSRMFGAKEDEMVEDLNKGDVAETVRVFFEAGSKVSPSKKSVLSIQDVENYLSELEKETKEDGQLRVLEKIACQCTGNDLKMVIRLIKHDLRMQAGAKHVLEALDKNAYEAFQASRDLMDVVRRTQEGTLEVSASVMTPVLPMLCDACRTVEMAFKKCPNGMYSEIKYDGERVQVHKHGNEFKYFSRSLKPVLSHKVDLFKEHIPRAFPKADSLMLDSEVLLIDTKTSKPLPFGTLGVHKKDAFSDANVCLFVFDCMHYNGQSLMNLPVKERRRFLNENMEEIPNRIMFSEMKYVTKPDDLKEMIARVLSEGLEGLVLKDVKSIYEPGKRHWLKVKKDYLLAGSMADSADLVVLGAYFGSGNKGGMMSIFLMGCWDERTNKFCTVTKCHSGFDDAQLARLQKTLKMIKIDKDKNRIPAWLKINSTNVNLVPEFIAEDPFQSPVWEITGAEFTRAELHTADGISIRFPRVTRVRDKTWKEATSLSGLQDLFKKSKEKTDFHSLLGIDKNVDKDVHPATAQSPDFKADDVGPPPLKVAKVSPTEKPTKLDKGKFPARKDETSTNGASSAFIDIFSGIRMYIPDVEENKLLRRYFVAFDGDLLEAHESEDATHVIDDVCPVDESNSVVRVSADWIWHSVRKGVLINEAAYRVVR